uniref:ShTK domain protein n=1 Tax=Haemonchus contortus TaxID=6289 RepID=A0A7I4YHX2_HAECO
MSQVNMDCLNQHFCCIAWASLGYCTARNQQGYMRQYCQAICGVCRGSTGSTTYNTPACNDFNSRCSTWRAQNQCTANRNYMWENCRQSCQACSIGMLSNRLSSCGLSRQETPRRRLVPRLRVSPTTSRQSVRMPLHSLQTQRNFKTTLLPAISQRRRPIHPVAPYSPRGIRTLSIPQQKQPPQRRRPSLPPVKLQSSPRSNSSPLPPPSKPGHVQSSPRSVAPNNRRLQLREPPRPSSVWIPQRKHALRTTNPSSA